MRYIVFHVCTRFNLHHSLLAISTAFKAPAPRKRGTARRGSSTESARWNLSWHERHERSAVAAADVPWFSVFITSCFLQTDHLETIPSCFEYSTHVDSAGSCYIMLDLWFSGSSAFNWLDKLNLLGSSAAKHQSESFAMFCCWNPLQYNHLWYACGSKKMKTSKVTPIKDLRFC